VSIAASSVVAADGGGDEDDTDSGTTMMPRFTGGVISVSKKGRIRTSSSSVVDSAAARAMSLNSSHDKLNFGFREWE